MHNNKVITLCNNALNSVKDTISEQHFKQVHDYINKHNEWGLGMEFLIDWLIDEKTSIARKQYEQIQVAISAMNLDHSYRMNYLEKHNVKSS